mgnify:CR=1 FL=1
MMIIQILEMTLPVLVVLVKSSFNVIKTPKQVAFIKDAILKEVQTIENVLPTVYEWERYIYNDKVSAYSATIRAIDDAIDEEITPRELLRYLRRLFIVSGKCIDDGEFHQKMVNLYHLEKYKEVNEDEM